MATSRPPHRPDPRPARKTTPLRKGVVPPDRTSFTNRELAAVGGCLPKTLSEWRRMGLLPRTSFAGKRTRYGRESARRVAAIARMGVQAARHPRFDEMLPLILDELPRTDARGPAGSTRDTPPAGSVAKSSEPDAPFTHAAWQRIELAPGIEIHLADFVAPIMRGVVREVAKRFGRAL